MVPQSPLSSWTRGASITPIGAKGRRRRDRLKIGGQAAIAIDGDDSLVG